MTTKEMVVKVLMDCGCQTSKSIACTINRIYNVSVTPSQVAGSLRPLIRSGWAANDKSVGKTVYWLNEEYKNKVREEVVLDKLR